MPKTDKKKLEYWQGRLEADESAYAGELSKMDEREGLYLGSPEIKPIAREEVPDRAPHVRNVILELIEAQVSSSIPQPKVTARRKKDERLARLIEDMLRDELDRMSFEELNDQQERTVPIQGGGAYLVEWDSSQRTHTTAGEVAVSLLHPKQIIPQAGVYTGIEDMDHIILKLPQTKGSIKRRYGVDVSEESESEPDARGTGESTAEDMVTQYVAYYRNDKGGIGLYSWVNDTQLEDLEDYQARRLRRCAKCGAPEPAPNTVTMVEPTFDGNYPGTGEWAAVLRPQARFGGQPPQSGGSWAGDGGGPYSPTGNAVGAAAHRGPWSDTDSPPDGRKIGKPNDKTVCPYCGGTKWEESEEDFEEPAADIVRTDGSVIPALERGPDGMPVLEVGQDGVPAWKRTRLPYYKPNIFPVVLQKNISVFGRFLGGSDVDAVASQQNTVNRLETKMLDKLLTAGSYMSLPVDATIQRNPGEMKIIRLDNIQDKSFIDVYDMEGDVSQDVAMLDHTYEEMRQVIGVTDSFQGRRDTTATSGTAKQFAAAQTAGRLESKRIMKNAAFQRLYEAIFKMKLAYADEPRPVPKYNAQGEREYEEFNRYDFLEQDAAGEWYWNDQFIFAVDDTSATLASNREAMWEETRLNLQTGAFGPLEDLETMIFFWTKMEMLHYPGAAETKELFKQRQAAQQEALAAQQQREAQMLALQAAMQTGGNAGGPTQNAEEAPATTGVNGM